MTPTLKMFLMHTATDARRQAIFLGARAEREALYRRDWQRLCLVREGWKEYVTTKGISRALWAQAS